MYLSFAKTRFICVFNNLACLSPNNIFEIKFDPSVAVVVNNSKVTVNMGCAVSA